MEYFLLETFVAVSDTLNLTQAASILYKTQPTISHRIKTLESQLGFSLFVRNKGKRSISLTNKGKAFLPIAKELMRLYAEVEMVQKNVKQSLTISSIDSIGTTIVPEICKELLNIIDVNLTIHTYQTKESYQLISDREVDIAFVSEYWEMNGVLCEPAFQQEYYVVKPSDNPAPIKTVHPRELDSKNEIFQSWGEEFANWHNKWWPEPRTPKVKVDSNSLLIPFLTNEESWTIIQAGNIAPLQKHMSIQIYRLDDAPSPRTCYMLTSSINDKYNSNVINEFKKTLSSYVANSDSIFLSPT